MEYVNVTQLLLALIVGLSLMMLLIMKTKIHAALALILAAGFVGMAGGMDIAGIPGIITSGFGNTLGGIGLVIAFGVMMGQVIEESGAAKVMARTFINWLRGKNEELAIAVTGFLVSIPIFADSGFIILSPLIRSISQNKKKSLTALGITLGVALCITHATIPPTPGPLAVIGQFGGAIDLGTFMLFSFLMGIPVLAVGLMCGKFFGNKYYKYIDENGEIVEVSRENVQAIAKEAAQRTSIELDPNEKYPSPLLSFAPIFVPVILILSASVLNMVASDASGMVPDMIRFLGAPVFAVAIGLLVSIYGLARSEKRETVIATLEKGLASCGTIIIITGAGGAFGNIIRASGAGDAIAAQLVGMSFPTLFLPFLMAAILKFALGSGTVAMITTASILAPIMLGMPGVNYILIAYAICMGSQVFSLQNDSLFWVVTRTLGMKKVKETVFGWNATVFITSWASFALLMVVSFIW